MRTFTLYNVFTTDDLEWLETDCNVLKENICNLKYGDVDCDYDYAQLALVDEDNKNIMFWSDNIHTSFSELIIGFKLAFDATQIKYKLKRAYIYNEDLRNMYSGVAY